MIQNLVELFNLCNLSSLKIEKISLIERDLLSFGILSLVYSQVAQDWASELSIREIRLIRDKIETYKHRNWLQL